MKYAALILAVLLSACGGSKSPTAPTPPVVVAPQPPNVSGQWVGIYRTGTCTTTGAASNSGFCASVANGGGMVWTPQQAGGSVSGGLSIGAFNISTTGTVNADGVVVLTGSAPIAVDVTINLTSWRGVIRGNTIEGTAQSTILTTNPVGSATVVGTFTLTR